MWESSDGWLVAWAFHECVLNRCSTLWLLRFAFFVATCDLTGLGVFATRRALRDVDVTRRQESRVHMACELRRLLARTPARLHRQQPMLFQGQAYAEDRPTRALADSPMPAHEVDGMPQIAEHA